MSDKNFMSKMYNLSRSATEWKYVAFFEMFLVLILVLYVIIQSYNVPVRLIPIMYPDKEYVTKQNSSDMEYLRVISDSDLVNFTSFTPDTIEKQMAKLKTRISPSASYLYKKIDELIAKKKQQKVSQIFLVKSQKVFGGNSIVATGVLKRWVNNENVYTGEITYVIKYDISGGIPLIYFLKGYNNYEKAVQDARK